MATSVLGRFAGLKIEDDDYTPSENPKKVVKAAVAKPKKPEPVKKSKKPPTAATSGTKKKTKKTEVTEQQWELWKQKDEEMVNGTYQAELTEAILLSKLEYEQQKVIKNQIRKQTEMEKKLIEPTIVKEKPQKKQKKKNIMSLDQFNDMVSGDDNKRLEVPPSEAVQNGNGNVPADTQFFDRVRDDVEKELQRDKYKEKVFQRQTASDEVINRVQFAEALEKKDLEIHKLTDEVTRLKDELLVVKTRNKKLCNILAQGEMRDMAEALVELEKLRQVQTELTSEVGSLHAQLEQERSRNLTTRTKDKRRKDN